jgi:hypothetical protein
MSTAEAASGSFWTAYANDLQIEALNLKSNSLFFQISQEILRSGSKITTAYSSEVRLTTS